MSFPLPPDAEKYREQLETRARIFYATSDLWLRVVAADGSWLADLHRRRGPDPEPASDALEPVPGHPAGTGNTPDRALEAFADALDARESQRDEAAV